MNMLQMGLLPNAIVIRDHMLRSASTFANLRQFRRQVSKLNQFVAFPYMAINTQGRRFTTQHSSLIDQWPIEIYHSSQDVFIIG
jgi:hypothetical protein